MELAERGIGGGERVRQAAHRVGDHQHEPEGRERLAGERKLHVVIGAKEPDAEHEAGDRDGRHRHLLDEPAARQPRAQHDVGQHRAQHHVDQAGEPAIEDGVADQRRGLAIDRDVMRERVGVGQHRERPDRADREQEYADVRRQRDGERQHHEGDRERCAAAAECAPRQPAAAALRGGEVAAAQHKRRQQHGAERAADHDDGDHVAHRIGHADRGDFQIRLRRQHVGDVEEKRRGEIVEHLDENECRAGDVTRQREREHDAAEQRETVCAEVLRGFFHRGIDVAERGREVEQDEREIVQRLDEDHAIEALHERNAQTQPVIEEKIDGAVAAIDQLHRYRAHEGRHHERHHTERVDERGARKAEARQDGGERHRKEAREEDGHRAHVERVPECLAQQGGGKKVAEVDEREAVGPREGDDDDAQDGDDQERNEEKRNEGERDDLRRARAEAGGERIGRRCVRRFGHGPSRRRASLTSPPRPFRRAPWPPRSSCSRTRPTWLRTRPGARPRSGPA